MNIPTAALIKAFRTRFFILFRWVRGPADQTARHCSIYGWTRVTVSEGGIFLEERKAVHTSKNRISVEEILGLDFDDTDTKIQRATEYMAAQKRYKHHPGVRPGAETPKLVSRFTKKIPSKGIAVKTASGLVHFGAGLSNAENGTGGLPDPVKHVGWYYNLPDSGERVVGDVIARDGDLIVISYTPGGSMCATVGHTWVMAMDACSGGRLAETTFDVDGNGGIDDQDTVDIGTSSEVLAPPTGIQYTGRHDRPLFRLLL